MQVTALVEQSVFFSSAAVILAAKENGATLTLTLTLRALLQVPNVFHKTHAN